MLHAHTSALHSLAGLHQVVPARQRDVVPARQRTRVVRIQAAATQNAGAEKPAWAGSGFVSDAVNFLINQPQIYGLMKIAAKQVLQSSAEKRGIPWRETVKQLEAANLELEQLKSEVQDPSISYPGYYLQQFHAYEKGNLEWLAAYEVEPATMMVTWRAFKDSEMDANQSSKKLRGNIINALKDYQSQHGCLPVHDIIDVGCSVGMSTQPLAEAWPHASVTGLDLSPYFLAVAEYRSREGQRAANITWRHGLAEAAPFPDESFDLVSNQFMIHECTDDAIRDVLREAKRLTRPGGTCIVVDINPRSPVIQGLPPAIFALMKSTEPHSDEYYVCDVEGAMREAGFEQVCSVEVDPRHYAVLGKSPSSV